MTQQLSISVNHALVIVFALGITVGFAGGIITEKTGLTDDQALKGPESASNSDNGGQNTGSNNGIVELQTTDFPYKGVEAGVGSADQTFNGTTFKLEGEPYIGSSDAEVVMVAYEDFECPFCNRYNNGAFDQIVSSYVESGQVKYYFKNFPLSRLHPWAIKGGIASECALNQDPEAFWIYKHGFFSNQDQLNNIWKQKPSAFDKTMKRWAEQIGLDTQKFNQCYDNREEEAEVSQDRQQGVSKGVSGTPTVFVADQKVVGAQPYSRFKSVIESKK